MSIAVNTNVQSLFAQRALSKNTMGLQRSVERLSTGFRINRAADDAAGLTIGQKLTSTVKGSEVAKKNAADGVSMIQTAEGALGIVQDNLQRIRELAVQAENGTNGDDELDAIQREINERVTVVNDIATQVEFNGNTLLRGGSNFTLQTGSNNGETTTLSFQSGTTNAGIDIDVNTTGAGSIGEGTIALDTFHVGGSGSVTANDTSVSVATGSLDDLDSMIDNVSRMRSYLGAAQNSLESKMDFLDVQTENASGARSRIMDVDVASESSTMLKNQILQQTATSMLSQANGQTQIALNLLP